jgi:hypothetical protein
MDSASKTQTTKAKKDKWNYIKLKIFTALEIINGVKRQAKKLAKNICKPHKELIAKIYKESLCS